VSDEKKSTARKKKNIKITRTDPLEALKMEIAEELGLIDVVRKKGWHSLSAKDAGRIGGLMAQRRKRLRQQENNS